MAALRSCLFSPALFAESSSTKLLIGSPANILPVGGLCEHRFPPLKTAAPRPRLAVQAQNRDAHAQPFDGQSSATGGYLHDEMERVTQQYREITAADDGFLYVEANSMSAWVCLSAKKALVMAARVMDSADIDLDVPSGISAWTAHRTVGLYAAVFSATAEDSFYKTVNKDTVVSFLRALTGLAAVSHILLEDALETIARMSAREGVLEYAFNSDVEAMYHKFKQQMSDLEGEIQKATKTEAACRLVVPTIRAGMMAAQSFVGFLVDRRSSALRRARIKSLV